MTKNIVSITSSPSPRERIEVRVTTFVAVFSLKKEHPPNPPQAGGMYHLSRLSIIGTLTLAKGKGS
jgi:hypothetical protein